MRLKKNLIYTMNKGHRPILPIDPIVNSKRILQTGQYQYQKSFGVEDIWLISYLHSLGKTKNEIYEIWEPIHLTREKNADNVWNLGPVFESLYQKGSGFVLTGRNEIVIFQEEIDEINKAKMLPWMKEYLLVLLGFFKAIGKKRCYIQDIPFSLIKSFVSIKRVKSEYNINQICREQGYVTMELKTKVNKRYGTTKEMNFFSITYAKDEGTPVFRAESILDINNAFPLLKNVLVCEQCGKTFDINSKTKRKICAECYRKKRLERLSVFDERHEKDKKYNGK